MRTVRFAALAAVVFASLHAADRPLAKLTVQLDWVAEPEHGGLYQALARGFFRALQGRGIGNMQASVELEMSASLLAEMKPSSLSAFFTIKPSSCRTLIMAFITILVFFD